MKTEIPLNSGLSLYIDPSPAVSLPYPTARIQKGLLLTCDGEELCEEGVGFGVPVIKRGLETVFPGSVKLSLLEGGSRHSLQAEFTLNLVEKISRQGGNVIANPFLYRCKNTLAALIRTSRILRGVLTTASNQLRLSLHWESVYLPIEFSTRLLLVYIIDPVSGTIEVNYDANEETVEGITEIILMHELGGNLFDKFTDSEGASQIGDEIGCWDAVHASWAKFTSSRHAVSFSLPAINGVKLFRGREVIDRRLAWSGFGYSIPPGRQHFSCVISVRREG